MAVKRSRTAIDVHGIGKRYRQAGRGLVPVLQDIDLALPEGTIFGLIGPNGAGKTTLIKILAGLLRPDTGGGSVLGFDLLRQHDEVRARVSLVAPTADVGIDNNLTVRQNLAFWAPVYGLRGAAARTRIDEVLAQFDLVDKADFWPMHISAGQRQRLALARSLLARTPLLFLDEPTNKLDLEGVRSVRNLIADLNRSQGVTVLLTTHVMEEAEELCAEIGLLREGILVAHRPTGELTRSLGLSRPMALTAWPPHPVDREALSELARLPGVLRALRLDGDPAGPARLQIDTVDLRATTPAVLAWLRERGWRLASMQATPVTLDDVFLALARPAPPGRNGAGGRP